MPTAQLENFNTTTMEELKVKKHQSLVANTKKSLQKNFLHTFGYIVSTSFVFISTCLPWQTSSNVAQARSSYIEFTNIPGCANPSTLAARNICSQQSLRRSNEELQQAYRLLLDKVAGEKRQNLVNSQLNWLNFRESECNFAGTLDQEYSAAILEKYECFNALTVQRTNDLYYYFQGRLPAWNSSSYNYQWANGQLNFLSNNLKRALTPAQETSLQKADSAWKEFRDTTCQYETLGWAKNARNCRLRLTEQRITDIADYIAKPSNTAASGVSGLW